MDVVTRDRYALFRATRRSGSRTPHVALVRLPEDPFLREAFGLAVSEGAYDGSKESPTLARAHGTRRVTDVFAAKPDRTK